LQSVGGAGAAGTAHAAHRLFQGGSGSGVDIACSIDGGVIVYRMEDRRSTSLDWPRGLYYRLLWSGVAAETQPKIAGFRDEPASRSRDELAAASRAVAALWADGDASAIVAAVGAYTRALRRFDDTHGLGIFDAGHAMLVVKAAEAGIVYKPCGAGGGDIGVALATSRPSLASFEKTAIRAGFSVLESSIDPRGAMLHDADEP
jgi:phosphomevalonate kinase